MTEKLEICTQISKCTVHGMCLSNFQISYSQINYDNLDKYFKTFSELIWKVLCFQFLYCEYMVFFCELNIWGFFTVGWGEADIWRCHLQKLWQTISNKNTIHFKTDG